MDVAMPGAEPTQGTGHTHCLHTHTCMCLPNLHTLLCMPHRQGGSVRCHRVSTSPFPSHCAEHPAMEQLDLWRVEAGEGLHIVVFPLPTAHPLGDRSPATPIPPCSPGTGGSAVLQQSASTERASILSLSLRVKLGGKLKHGEMQTSAAGASQGALLRRGTTGSDPLHR